MKNCNSLIINHFKRSNWGGGGVNAEYFAYIIGPPVLS